MRTDGSWHNHLSCPKTLGAGEVVPVNQYFVHTSTCIKLLWINIIDIVCQLDWQWLNTVIRNRKKITNKTCKRIFVYFWNICYSIHNIEHVTKKTCPAQGGVLIYNIAHTHVMIVKWSNWIYWVISNLWRYKVSNCDFHRIIKNQRKLFRIDDLKAWVKKNHVVIIGFDYG